MAKEDVLDLPSPEACVICLERLTERAVALPCKHDHFDFGCLGTWLQQQRVCPLCKGAISAIRYDLDTSAAGTLFDLSPPRPTNAPQEGRHRCGRPHQRRHSAAAIQSRFSRGRRVHIPEHPADAALTFRRHVYRLQLFSHYVGCNPISRYQNITPASFISNPALISRAKTWIRRELSVFDFLNPCSPTYGRSDRRASNAEFLLEYVVSILKSIDLRGSAAQAEALLHDFLGKENARLFLHELEAFLRSPFQRVEEWDRHVQYAESNRNTLLTEVPTLRNVR